MKKPTPELAVKYCGGCNPRYDRIAAVRELEKRLGRPLPAARPGVWYQAVYVVCGCTARCADVSALAAQRFILVDSPDMPCKPGDARQEG